MLVLRKGRGVLNAYISISNNYVNTLPSRHKLLIYFSLNVKRSAHSLISAWYLGAYFPDDKLLYRGTSSLSGTWDLAVVAKHTATLPKTSGSELVNDISMILCINQAESAYPEALSSPLGHHATHWGVPQWNRGRSASRRSIWSQEVFSVSWEKAHFPHSSWHCWGLTGFSALTPDVYWCRRWHPRVSSSYGERNSHKVMKGTSAITAWDWKENTF